MSAAQQTVSRSLAVAEKMRDQGKFAKARKLTDAANALVVKAEAASAAAGARVEPAAAAVETEPGEHAACAEDPRPKPKSRPKSQDVCLSASSSEGAEEGPCTQN